MGVNPVTGGDGAVLIKEIKEGRRNARHGSPTCTPPLLLAPLRLGRRGAGVPAAGPRPCLHLWVCRGRLRAGSPPGERQPPLPCPPWGAARRPPPPQLLRVLGTGFLGHWAPFGRRAAPPGWRRRRRRGSPSVQSLTCWLGGVGCVTDAREPSRWERLAGRAGARLRGRDVLPLRGLGSGGCRTPPWGSRLQANM